MSAQPLLFDARLPLISVALCTRNGASFIDEQIESLLAQDDPAFEVVASDDASTDDTFKRLQCFESPHFRIFSNNESLGFNSNFASCFQKCSGDLIAPCDQDDIWAPDKLSRLRALLGTRALVYSDSELIDENGKSLGRKLSDLHRLYQGYDPLAFAFRNCASGHAMLFRRELLASALPLPPDEAFYDWWLAAVATMCGGISYTSATLVGYRQHGCTQTDVGGKRALKKPAYVDFVRARIRFLKALSGRASSPEKERIAQFANLLESRFDRYFCWELATFTWQNRQTLFNTEYISAFRLGRRALDYGVGLKLKRVVRPGKYRDDARS